MCAVLIYVVFQVFLSASLLSLLRVIYYGVLFYLFCVFFLHLSICCILLDIIYYIL